MSTLGSTYATQANYFRSSNSPGRGKRRQILLLLSRYYPRIYLRQPDAGELLRARVIYVIIFYTATFTRHLQLNDTELCAHTQEKRRQRPDCPPPPSGRFHHHVRKLEESFKTISCAISRNDVCPKIIYDTLYNGNIKIYTNSHQWLPYVHTRDRWDLRDSCCDN